MKKSTKKGLFHLNEKLKKSSHLRNLRSNHLKSNLRKKIFVHCIKLVNLSLNELKTISKIRGIKGYESMSEERLLAVLNESESVKEIEKNFDDARIEKIKKDFNKLRERLSVPKTKEIKRDLYRIQNKKNLSTQTIETIEKKLSKLKKYDDYDE